MAELPSEVTRHYQQSDDNIQDFHNLFVNVGDLKCNTRELKGDRLSLTLLLTLHLLKVMDNLMWKSLSITF